MKRFTIHIGAALALGLGLTAVLLALLARCRAAWAALLAVPPSCIASTALCGCRVTQPDPACRA